MTKEAREWCNQVDGLLEDYKDLVDLAQTWRETGGYFNVRLTFFYPSHIFWNKSRQVSAKTIDLSNCEKSIIDRVFLNKMEVDDRFIVKLESHKAPDLLHHIRIEVELV